MTTTIKIQLSPLNVIRICRVVFAAIDALRAQLGEKSGLAWEQLPERIRIDVEKGVRDIHAGRARTHQQMHERWRDAMMKDGWRGGLVKDYANKIHPAICAFDELPVLDQAKYALFFSMTQTLIFHYALHQHLGGGQS